MNRNLAGRALAFALSMGLLAACSSPDGASDPTATGGGEQDLTAAASSAKASLGNWDCTAEDDGTAIEDLAIRTTLKGGAKADLDVSGPGDFFETYHYKATATQQSNGDIVITGASFHLTISGDPSGPSHEHLGTLSATGPKSAQLFANQKIGGKVGCIEQTPDKVAKEGEICGANASSTVACASGLTCKSNCPAGAHCIVAINTCQK